MLTTNRLNIRTIAFIDLEAIHQLHSLPETDEYNTLGIPASIAVTNNLLNEWLIEQEKQPRGSYIFSIELINTKQFIGLIALKLGKPNYQSAEVWYKLHKDYWRQGYTTEALKCLLAFGFNELQLHRIEAGCAAENIASCCVLEKVGMIKEGLKRKKLPIRGEWKDNYFYGILEEEFKEAAEV